MLCLVLHPFCSCCLLLLCFLYLLTKWLCSTAPFQHAMVFLVWIQLIINWVPQAWTELNLFSFKFWESGIVSQRQDNCITQWQSTRKSHENQHRNSSKCSWLRISKYIYSIDSSNGIILILNFLGIINLKYQNVAFLLQNFM